MTRNRATDQDVIASEAQIPEGAQDEFAVAEVAPEDSAPSGATSELAATLDLPPQASAAEADPEVCLVVRPVFETERAFCSVDRGSHQIEDPFRVNGRFEEGEREAAAGDSAALLVIFAKRIAGVITAEAKQRGISIVRVRNNEAGAATAAALREAGFRVIEFGE